MTPTLAGRWQTRLFLMATVGVLATLPFALGWLGFVSSVSYWSILVAVTLLGLVWDVGYTYLQSWRWDRDWPALFYLLAGVAEALLVWGLSYWPGLPLVSRNLPLAAFLPHYAAVWLAVFTASQTMMRVAFPYWRFRGGQLF